MNKRTRLLIVLAALALCLVCLWPSITWYWRTPREVQALALGSLQNIKEYAISQAAHDVRAVIAQARETPEQELGSDYRWLKKPVAAACRQLGRAVPNPLTLSAVLSVYENEQEFQRVIQAHYRDTILKAKKTYENSVKLGLDLSGGMNIIVKADLDAAFAQQDDAQVALSPDDFRARAMEQVITSLTNRIDRFGLTSPVIRQQGEDRIYIEIPGAAQADAINTLIKGKGILNFRLVDSDATNRFRNYVGGYPVSLADETFRELGIIPDDCEVLGIYKEDEFGLDQQNGYLVVHKEAVLDGQHIKSASISTDPAGHPLVLFSLDTEGAVIFKEFTASHVKQAMAIVSDDQVKAYANIDTVIPDGRVQITGFRYDEALAIQRVLQTAWLNVPLTVESQQIIGASLGEATIRQGMRALIVGLGIILLFMLVYYRGAGVNAAVAQILNLYGMFSILSAFNMTITLSSIAGMILTIGMAVDANVIIFERIKEEIRLGKSRAAAVSAGFKNAFWSIMDSNVTTFIAAFFLSQLGTGAIQGFAVSLAIGVLSSLFTALFVSHLMFDFMTEVMHKERISIGWGGE
ncbi:MAG: protein translocase subunit SecD [Treponema sp.]|nr:protein translocase subunit SecD [Treponema sp.]